MTDDLQQARVEAAMRAYRDHRGGELRGKIRAVLAAADAHLPTVEQIAEVIHNSMCVLKQCDFRPSTDQREAARAVRALFGEVAGDERR